MSILFIQPIFAPDKPRLQRNLDSIRSFGTYIEKFPYADLDVGIGGWAKEEYWPVLKKHIQKYIGENQSIKKFDKNYGKAKTVNSLYKTRNKKLAVDAVFSSLYNGCSLRIFSYFLFHN